MAPLIVAGDGEGGEATVMGTLNIFYAEPRAQEQEQGHGPDHAALRAVADLAALAISVARTQQQDQALLRRWQALDQASTLLAADLQPLRVLRRIVEVAMELVGARYGALGIASEDGYLADFITVGLSDDERAALGPLPRGHGLLGVLIREGRPLRIPDIRRDARRVGFPPHHPPMTSLLGVPIRVRGAVVGDLYLTDKTGAPEFSAEDQRVIELLAMHAGIAIHNARLYVREQHAHQLLQQQTATLREQAQLIELAHDAILVRDLENRVVQWNSGAVGTYGWTAAEARGQVTHTLLQTRFPVSLQEMEAALRERGQWEGELDHARRDATRLVVESRQVLLRDAGGQPTAILEINREITQRKRAEAALRLLAESGMLLGAMLDEEAVLAATAGLAVPALADWCSLILRDAHGEGAAARYRRRAVAHAEPTGATADRVSLRDQPYLANLDAERGIGAVLRTGQPEFVTAVTEADLGAVAEDDAHLARVRARGILSYMLVPLKSQAQTLGVITFAAAESGRHYTPDDLVLAQDLARRTALALTNARLHRQVEEFTMLRERERIGRDLHDGIIQDLYALMLNLEGAAKDSADAGQQVRLHSLAAQLSTVMGDIRAYIQGSPAHELVDQPLAEALAALVREVAAPGTLTVTHSVEGEPVALPLEHETALLQTTREALSNVIKHARAEQARVQLVYRTQAVELTISDDGQGFAVETEPGAEHRGLRNLRSRAAELGGSLTVRSATGAGTTIQVTMPLPVAR